MRKSEKITRAIFGGMKSSFIFPIFGSALKREREALGASRKDFAKLCGWTTSFLRGIEQGGTGVRYLSCFDRDRIVAAIIVLCNKKVSGARKNL